MPKYNETPDSIQYIKALEARLERLERSSQLAQSSVEDGAVGVNNSDGTQVMQIGKQFDDTYAPVVLTSPVPPAPTSPIVTDSVNGIAVEWDGAFAAAALCPMDFAYVAVYVGAAGFDPFLTTPVHVFNSPQGGAIFISLPPGVWQAKLVTRTLAGVPSIASAGVNGTAGTTTGAVEFSDGNPPASSPVPVAVGGVGSFFLTWTPVANADLVTYAIYGGTTAGFTANASSLIGTTGSSSMNAKAINGVPFSFDQDYYFKIIASDADGAAGVSAASNVAQMAKITNEYVAASYVYAGEVYANQLRSGTSTADISIAGSFSTAPSGQRSIMDGFGIRQYGPDGTSIITDLPNEGNPMFTGIVNAFGLIVNGGLEFRGQNNSFAMGSITTLETTTSGSTIAPNISANWETIDSGLTQYLYNLRGFHRDADGGEPWGVYAFFGLTKIIGPGGINHHWATVTNTDGNTVSKYDVGSSTYIRTAGGFRQVLQGTYVAANGVPGVQQFTLINPTVMTTGGTVQPTVLASTPFSGFSWTIGTRIGRCFSPIGSGTLENNFAAVRFDAGAKTFQLSRWACTDAAFTQQGSTSGNIAYPWSTGQNPGGIVYGSSAKMGFPGTDQNIWIIFADKAYAYSTAYARLPDFDFPLAGDANWVSATGSTAAGANGFVRFESAPNYNDDVLMATKYTNIHWLSADSPVWWATYTWNDSNGVGHESDMAVQASITMPKRMRWTITTPNLPDPAAGMGQPRDVDDVNSIRVYMGRGASIPARTAMWKQNVQPADLATTITYDTLPQFSGTTNPPAVTSFIASAPAKLQSSAVGADGLPKVLIDGSGFMHSETLDVSGAGATSLQGKAFDQLYYGIRAQALLSGGGNISVSATYEVKWSTRFIVISQGRDAGVSPDGHFSIASPPAATIINGFGGASNKTVTANGVPLGAWEALYYVLPYGSANTSLNANFRVVSYLSNFVVPNDWIMICVRNNDSTRVEFTNGNKVNPNQTVGDLAVWVGNVNVSVNAGLAGSYAVTFPSGLFNTVPTIQATPGSGRLNCAIGSPTTSGFTLSVNNWTTGNSGSVPVYITATTR